MATGAAAAATADLFLLCGPIPAAAKAAWKPPERGRSCCSSWLPARPAVLLPAGESSTMTMSGAAAAAGAAPCCALRCRTTCLLRAGGATAAAGDGLQMGCIPAPLAPAAAAAAAEAVVGCSCSGAMRLRCMRGPVAPHCMPSCCSPSISPQSRFWPACAGGVASCKMG